MKMLSYHLKIDRCYIDERAIIVFDMCMYCMFTFLKKSESIFPDFQLFSDLIF
jgi:hypothetical protein